MIINTIAATLTLATILVWKPLKNDTQLLVGNLALSEIGLSISSIGLASYHLHNIRFGISGRMSQRECFPKAGAIALFITLNASFYFVLSIDRFLAAVCPMFYRTRNRRYVIFVTSFVWLINFSLIILGLISDTSDEVFLSFV